MREVVGLTLEDDPNHKYAIEIDGIIALGISNAVDEKWPTLKTAILDAVAKWWELQKQSEMP